ncbi:MAG: hypothetical protein H0T89_00605 [Deltaproteobacteria bacterium]|nr:hypothetical protein [Deltaproteobacteria bacterium]MDQ3297932.1 hypothetical protein [Myxococcota bacterium]
MVAACSYDEPSAIDGGISGSPGQISIVSGDQQRGAVGEPLAQPLVVLIADLDQRPIENLTVDFTVVDGAGTLSTTTLRTDVQGLAQAVLTLGTKVATNTVEVRASGLASEPVTFTATAVAAAPATLVKVSDDQFGTVTSPLVSPLVVKLEDRFQNPIANERIDFSVVANNGLLSPSMVMTDADGFASTGLTLGSMAGDNTVEARAAALPGTVVTLRATGVAGEPAALAVTSGNNNQSAVAGTMLAEPFVVTALDSSNNPRPGTTVTFVITAGNGALPTTSTFATGADGRAQITLTLDTRVGTNTVEARSGTLAPAVFSATGVVGAPAKFSAVSGNAQPNIVAGNVAAPLVVLVTDVNDNPVPNLAVGFSVVGGGGSVSPSAPTTSSLGRAQAIVTTGTTVATNTVHATVAGLPTIAFTTTTIPGPPTHFVGLTAIPANATVASTVGPIVVQVRDKNSNPVPSVSVTFVVNSGGGSMSSSTVTSDSLGRAQTTWTLGTVAGGNSGLANASGVSQIFFNITGTHDAPFALTKVSGDQQVTICDGEELPNRLVAQIKDRFGNAVTNVGITFTAPTGGCFLVGSSCSSPLTVGVDNGGKAEVRYRTAISGGNGSVATDSIKAQVGSLVTTFTAEVHGC